MSVPGPSAVVPSLALVMVNSAQESGLESSSHAPGKNDGNLAFGAESFLGAGEAERHSASPSDSRALLTETKVLGAASIRRIFNVVLLLFGLGPEVLTNATPFLYVSPPQAL